MLVEAEGWVRRFVRSRGGFYLFALAKHADGKIGLVQPTSDFPDAMSAMTETIRCLLALAQVGQIDACVIFGEMIFKRDAPKIFVANTPRVGH